jgi:hypothetical protein
MTYYAIQGVIAQIPHRSIKVYRPRIFRSSGPIVERHSTEEETAKKNVAVNLLGFKF